MSLSKKRLMPRGIGLFLFSAEKHYGGYCKITEK
jgi:hypothetical protein